MRSHPNARLAMTYAGMLALCAQPAPADEMTDGERKTPPPPPEPKAPPANRPGETNRQLAARLKAERANPQQEGR